MKRLKEESVAEIVNEIGEKIKILIFEQLMDATNKDPRLMDAPPEIVGEVCYNVAIQSIIIALNAFEERVEPKQTLR